MVFYTALQYITQHSLQPNITLQHVKMQHNIPLNNNVKHQIRLQDNKETSTIYTQYNALAQIRHYRTVHYII